MSRNLCRTDCVHCKNSDFELGKSYPVADDHPYNSGMVVSNATCKTCGTKYIAWIGPTSDGYGARDCDRYLIREHGFYDLSYRSTFDDEPGDDDIPFEKLRIFKVFVIDGKIVKIQEDED